MDGWHDGDEVSFRLAFPLLAAFVRTELELTLTGDLIVEDTPGCQWAHRAESER